MTDPGRRITSRKSNGVSHAVWQICQGEQGHRCNKERSLENGRKFRFYWGWS